MQISLRSPKSEPLGAPASFEEALTAAVPGVCQEHATCRTSVLPPDSEHSTAGTAIRLEGGSFVPRTTSSWRFGHQHESQSTSEPPAGIPQPAPPVAELSPRGPRTPVSLGAEVRARRPLRSLPGAAAARVPRVSPKSLRPPSFRPAVSHGSQSPRLLAQPFTSASHSGSDAPEAPFAYGAGKEDGGAQQPVRREDAGSPESGRARA